MQHIFLKLIPRNSRLKIILKVKTKQNQQQQKTSLQTIKNLNHLTLNIYCAPNTYESLTSGQEYPHELCSADAPGLLFHLESVAILSHRFLSPIFFWCGCPHVHCPQDFRIPFHLQHHTLSYSGRNKEGWCLHQASKNIPQSLEFLTLSYWPELGPGACCSVNESIKRRILSRNITSSNKIKVGLPIKRERKNITRGACSNQ